MTPEEYAISEGFKQAQSGTYDILNENRLFSVFLDAPMGNHLWDLYVLAYIIEIECK